MGGSLTPLGFGSCGRIAVMSLCPCCKDGVELWSSLDGGGSTVSSSGAVQVLRETRWDPCLLAALASV